MIYQYKNPLLLGKPCMIHEGFTSGMDMFCRFLGLTGCKYFVTCSYDRDHLTLTPAQGAVVKPASHGDHLIGHAVDGNVIDKSGKDWTSEMMHVFCPHHPDYDINKVPQNEVHDLIKYIRNSQVIRWGGDWIKYDPVHVDDGLYQMNPARWQQIYNELYPEK